MFSTPAQLVSLRERLDRANGVGRRARDRGLPGRAGQVQPADRRALGRGARLPAHHRAGARAPTRCSSAPCCPTSIYPPMFNRYSEGMKFGAHVDGSVRIHPHDGRKLRTDVSATLFLTNPDEYDGGELADRGHLRPPQHQAARPATWWSIRRPACTRWRRSRAGCARLLLLGAEPDPRRHPARPCSTRWTTLSSASTRPMPTRWRDDR